MRAWRTFVPVNTLVMAGIAIGLLNNIAIAATFGLTREVDAYYAALMLPSLFMFLCVDYLGKNFMPVLVQAHKESEASASQMVSSVVTIMALIGALTAVVLAAASKILFALLLPGFEATETELVVRYFWVMAPAIVFMAINTFHEYVCQYDEDFVSVMAIRLTLPLVNLLAIVALAPFLGSLCLPVGFLLGHVTMFVLLARQARYRYRPRLTIRKHLERKIFTNTAIVMSTGLIARTKSIVTNVIASTLGSGAIAALAFTTKLTEPLERSAFSGAKMLMFSQTAKLHADNRLADLGQIYAIAIRISFMALAPLLWWVMFHSDTIVETIFARGAFTPEMAVVVAAALAALAPWVLFSGVGQLLANAFYAMGRVTVPAMVMPFGMVVFLIAAPLLAPTLGVQGLALATTVASICVFSVLFTALARTIPIPWRRVAVALLGYAGLGAGAMGAAAATTQGLPWPPLAISVISLMAGAVLYFGMLAAYGDRALLKVWRFAGRQWLAIRGLRQRLTPP